MGLMEDIQEHYKTENYPPGPYDFADGETQTVSEEDHDELRWGTSFTNVYKRGDELVAVSDVRPATEMQDWGDYGDPEIYPVVAKTETITVTRYTKVGE